MSTTDIYLGGLYNCAKIEGAAPYLGLGYARIKGKWHNSYYSGMPGGAGYGESGKTTVDGYLISVKHTKRRINLFSNFEGKSPLPHLYQLC
jgi:hypothetical protein